MSDETLVEIETQIRDLHVKADAARKVLQTELDEEFKKCGWLKDVVLHFQDMGYSIGCGITYRLGFGPKDSLFKSGVISSFASLPLYGDSPHYQNNITLRSEDYGGYSLNTDSAETLLRFLEEFKPRIAKCESFDRRFNVFTKIKELMI